MYMPSSSHRFIDSAHIHIMYVFTTAVYYNMIRVLSSRNVGRTARCCLWYAKWGTPTLTRFGKEDVIMPGTIAISHRYSHAMQHPSQYRTTSVTPVRGHESGGVFVKMIFHIVPLTLTAVNSARMIILPRSVHYRVETFLVRVITDNPKGAARILDGVLPRYFAP